VKTFTAHGVWAMCALTAVTGQSTVGVLAAGALSPELVVAQIDAVASDIGVDAAKTGMLANPEVVRAVAGAVARHGIESLVVDPVLATTRGEPLLAAGGIEALRTDLIPLATLVTPNLAEAAALSGSAPIHDEDGMAAAAETIGALGVGAVLVKGGHLRGDPLDLLWIAGRLQILRGERIPTPHTHGTGCVLSAAVAARLARGEALEDAVEGARRYVRAAIAAGMALGSGRGPIIPPPAA
jgi:hydroxymethylpyrimidine/phosphomethylpyrimidine kinase